MKIIISLLVLAGLISCADPQPKAGQGVDLDSLDNALAEMYDRMVEDLYELPEGFADTFEVRLEEMLRNPATFNYQFDSLRGRTLLDIVETPDRSIQIFRWFHPWSGQLEKIPAIVRYKTPSGKTCVFNMRDLHPGDKTYELNMMESANLIWYDAVYRLNDSVCLMTGSWQMQGDLLGAQAECYRLTEQGLVPDSAFAENGDTSSLISFDWTWYLYHPYDSAGITVYPYALFDYDERDRILKFPEMVDVQGSDVPWISEPTGDTVRLGYDGRFFRSVSR